MNSSLYNRAKETDSVLGRVGHTIDWTATLPDGLPDEWGTYPRPPLASDWRAFMAQTSKIVARNAVRPFHMHFDCQCNMILLSDDACRLLGPLTEGSISDLRPVDVVFGKRARHYQIGRLRLHLEWTDTDNSSLVYRGCVFERVMRMEHDIHGTRVARGQETRKDCPEPVETGLVFSSHQALRSVAYDTNTELIPRRLCLDTEHPPVVFAFGQDAYVRHDIALHLAALKDAGVNFPYAPLEVTTASA